MESLFTELVNGAPKSPDYAFMLNPGDEGLLRSLDKLSADDASSRATSGACIAAHVDHLRYGFSLMNRWAAGENPFGESDFAKSWSITHVSDSEWADLRQALRDQCTRWLEVIRTPRDARGVEVTLMVSTIAHLAYHIGAIRQISRAAGGPSATASQS